jgi:hypothetical protein
MRLGPGLPPELPLLPLEELMPGVLATGPLVDKAGLGGAGVRMVGATGLGGKAGLALATFSGLGALGIGGAGGCGVGTC